MTLFNIFKRFRFRISITLFLVLFEGVLFVLYPLLIGKAIESAMENSYDGLFHLVILCLLSLFVGSIRRFYDSRIYAGIFSKLASQLSEQRVHYSTSKISANVSLLREIVLFFENSMPQLIGNLIGLVGTLLIVFTLNRIVFLACLSVLFLIIFIYWISRNRTIKYNHNYNNELEEQVQILEGGAVSKANNHFNRLMKWNVKLSDIETINYSCVWLFLSALLCFAVVLVIQQDALLYGVIFSIIMYVFQFMENAMNLPFYYQQSLRLKDISKRLNKMTIKSD